MSGFFGGIGDKVGEHFIETFFISMIEGFTIKDLELAVRENISLLDQTQLCNPRSLAFAGKIAKKFSGCSVHLTLENVMDWTREKRNDLYWHFLKDPVAKAWLNRNVLEFKSFLFGY